MISSDYRPTGWSFPTPVLQQLIPQGRAPRREGSASVRLVGNLCSPWDSDELRTVIAEKNRDSFIIPPLREHHLDVLVHISVLYVQGADGVYVILFHTITMSSYQ